MPLVSQYGRAARHALLLAVLGVSCKAPPAKQEAVLAAKPSKEVLVLLSSANLIELKGGRSYHTGYFLNELMVPVQSMLVHGYTPVFATPSGQPPVMDPHSDAPSFFANEAEYAAARARQASLSGLQHPHRIADFSPEQLGHFVGVFVPGGHAAMGDLATDADVGRVLLFFHERHRATGLICHGPAALLSTVHSPSSFVSAMSEGQKGAAALAAAGFPYANYRLTVFTTAEEKQVEEGGAGAFLGGFVKFYVDEALRSAGAIVDTAEPWHSHVVRDRELITAQQPGSDTAFTAAFMQALGEPPPAPIKTN